MKTMFGRRAGVCATERAAFAATAARAAPPVAAALNSLRRV